MNKDKLISQINNAKEFEFLFFLDYKEKNSGYLDESCLSQFYPSKFTTIYNTKEITMPTAEHYMMFSKAIYFKDYEIANKILDSKNPRDVKALGRAVKGFDDKSWREVSFDIVVEGNLQKFSQNSRLKEYLLSTDNKILVEASPKDRKWGIGLSANDSRAKNPKEWLGENLLGFALMRVREILKNR